MTHHKQDPFEQAGLSVYAAARAFRDADAKAFNFEDWLNSPRAIPRPRPRWNDAEVIGDLASATVLDLPAVIGVTDRAPRVSGDKWGRFAWTWREVVEVLTQHPERADKGGNALFFADSELTGKRRNGVSFFYKLKDKIQKVYAVAIDVDGGCTVESVVQRIRARGLFAVVYTTHSHASKGGQGSDRFRVILPLSEPFDMGAGDRRKARAGNWEALYVGLCGELMPEWAQWDFSASRPSQLMYAPARPKGAPFKHYVIAGAALDLATVTPGDASPFRKSAPTGSARGAAHDGGPAFLSDGFDLMAWHADHGEYFLLESFLEWIGWDVGSAAGGGFEILCPNAAAHSPGSGETAWAIDGLDANNGATIFCHHDHCSHLRTWDFLRMLEETAALPDGFATLSELLCDESLYPSEVDGEAVEVRRGDYVEETIKLDWLKTPVAVKRAFKALGDHYTEDHLAALFAGICKAGSRADALAVWADKVKEYLDANGRKRIEKRGREMLEDERAAFASEKAEERREEYAKALDGGTPANVSLDPAEPLGDDMATALATLAHRFAPCDLGGKFRIVRKPDLAAFGSDYDSTIAVYQREDFLNLHLDRQVKDGDSLVNPAKVFLETEKRKSGIVFAPPPMMPGENDFNMYQGRKLKAQAGEFGDERDFPTLHDFMLRIVCAGSKEKLAWLTLWMAHLVQRPGEKPGTSVIAVGEGGIGKGRFGALLGKLASPHFKQLENEAHVTGQFAGEHLSKCVLVQVNEAVFGASPKVSSTLKALIDSTSIQVEAKGLSLTTVPSFVRFYFDSNDAVPVLIENNGSERRYFVLRFDPAERGNRAFFEHLTEAIEGAEMAALLAYLETYNPADAGLGWAAVRIAPETPERRVMGWHSMRPAMRRLCEVLRDAEVTLMVDGSPEPFAADKTGLRLPKAAFRAYIAAAGNKHSAEDSDVAAMVQRLFGVQLEEGQGKVGSAGNLRWWLFPPELLGENVDKMLKLG